MIVVDASVLIAHFEATDAHHTRATTLLLDATSDELVASPLSLAEVLVGPARAGRLDEAVAALQDPHVVSVNLDGAAGSRRGGDL